MVDKPHEWQSLSNSAMLRRHSGDVFGAIEDMEKALRLIRNSPDLKKDTALKLNYLADLYLSAGEVDRAEDAIREAIELSRHLYPIFYADDLLILAEVLSRKRNHREATAAAEEALSLYHRWYRDYPERVAEVEAMAGRIRSTTREPEVKG